MISLLLLISAVMRLHDEMKVAATSQTITALLLHLHHESLTYCVTLEISIMTNSAPEAREHLPTPVSVVTLKLTMNTNH